MDRDGWLKSMTQFSNVCGDSPVKNHILFFDEHNSHFNDVSLIQIMCKNNEPFVIKSGDSINNQHNDNGLNPKLRSLYNVSKSAWMLKFRKTNFSPRHMKSVLVEAWDAFKMSYGNISRDIFAKQSYSSLSLLPQQQILRHVMPTSKYFLETWLKK